jgi:hypothetical protein
MLRGSLWLLVLLSVVSANGYSQSTPNLSSQLCLTIQNGYKILAYPICAESKCCWPISIVGQSFFDQDYVGAMSRFLDPGSVGTIGATLVVNGHRPW